MRHLTRDRISATATAAVALLLAAVAAGQAGQLYSFYLAQDRLPQWDMAGHAWGGIELHQALRQGSVSRFLLLLNRQDKWPFGFSLLLLPFVWAGGDSFAAATLLSAVLFALTPLLLLWAAREVDEAPVGIWSGLLAALLFLTSPLLRVFAVLLMREEAGVFFSLLAFCCYLRARLLGSPTAWRLAGLAGLALFFVKYNYAVIWGAAVAAHEVLRLSPERRAELGRAVGHRLWPWGSRRGSLLAQATAVYFWLLVGLTLFRVNVGNEIYGALVVATAWLAWRGWREPRSVTAWWERLPVAGRAVLASLVLPLWIWFLSPRHLKEMIAFLRNRTTGPPVASLASLLYYPRAFVHEYLPAPLGIMVLALFVLSLLGSWWGRREGHEPRRVLLLMAGLSFLLPTLHPYKVERFLATAFPFALLAATSCVSRLAHAPPFRVRRAVGAALCATAALGIAVVARGADLPERLARDYRLYSADPAFARPLDWIAGAAAGSRRLGLIGSFGELSENLIRCRLAQRGGKGGQDGSEVTPPLPRFHADLPAAAVRARLDDWRREGRPDRIVALRLLPGSPLYAGADYQTYNAWQLAAIDGLAADPTLRIAARQLFPETQVEIVVFEP